jgi:hypothetical protein
MFNNRSLIFPPHLIMGEIVHSVLIVTLLYSFILNIYAFLCFVDRASRYNRVKKKQFDAQHLLSIFCQPLQVSVLSMPIIKRYNCWGTNQDNRQLSKRNNKYQLLYTYGCTS